MLAARLVTLSPATFTNGVGRSMSRFGLSGEKAKCVRWFVQDSRSGATTAGRGQSTLLEEKD